MPTNPPPNPTANHPPSSQPPQTHILSRFLSVLFVVASFFRSKNSCWFLGSFYLNGRLFPVQSLPLSLSVLLIVFQEALFLHSGVKCCCFLAAKVDWLTEYAKMILSPILGTYNFLKTNKQNVCMKRSMYVYPECM